MSDDGFWQVLKEHKKEKFDADRKRFLEQAIATDDGGWTKHTKWHWSRMVNGHRLDYWPSRKKFQYQGQVMRGLWLCRGGAMTHSDGGKVFTNKALSDIHKCTREIPYINYNSV